MTKSETSSRVLRMTSLVLRHRLTPQIECSTRTRIRESEQFLRFWVSVSSRPRGFFSVAGDGRRWADIPESQYLDTGWCLSHTRCSRGQQFFCRAPSPHTFGSDSSRAWSFSRQSPGSCRCGSFSCHYRATPVFQGFWGVGDDARCHLGSRCAQPYAWSALSQRPGRLVRA